MPKARVEFVCRECGYMNPRSLGRCPECDAWGSFDEVRQQPSAEPARRGNGHTSPASRPLRLAEIDTADFDRLPVAMGEFARVLGGGLVKGSVTLIGDDPGICKTTLLSQVADQVAHDSAGEVLYVSGEESVTQIGLRARRMGLHA